MKMRVTIDGQSFTVEIGDLNARPIPVQVDGEAFIVWPEEDGKLAAVVAAATAAAEEAAAAAAGTPAAPSVMPVTPVRAAEAIAAGKTKSVLAPIPGVILSIAVKEGDLVVIGQELFILEAMKMKNIIRANRAGKVGKLCISSGDQVRHNQVLMEYTD